MNIFKALWNWRRNAREEEIIRFEDHGDCPTRQMIYSEKSLQIYEAAKRESSRMKAMG